MKRFAVIFSLAVALLVFIAAGRAGAVATLDFVDSSGTVVMTVSDPSGVVSYTGIVAGYSFTVTTGETKPAVGSAASPVLDLCSLDISYTGPGSPGGALKVMFSDTGFTASPSNFVFSSSISWLYSATVSAAAYWGTGLFDTTNLIANLASGSGTATGAVASGQTAYSLTEVLTITPDPGGCLDFSLDNLTLAAGPTPEPASFFLVSGTLTIWGLSRLRKKAQQ